MKKRYGLFINGKWEQGNDYYETVNPADEEVLAEITLADENQTQQAIDAAREALDDWASDPLRRKRILKRFAEEIRNRQEMLGKWESLDNGMPLGDGMFGAENAADHYEYFAEWTDKIHGLHIPLQQEFHHYTTRVPLGVTAHIIPWNVPLIITARSVAPALAAGNTVIIKPAKATSITTLLLVESAEAAGIPAGVFNVLTGNGITVGKMLCTSPDVDAVIFTGSNENGKDVIEYTSSTMKKVMLELGGKSPNLVFADALMPETLEGVMKAIFLNSGQECFAGSRLIIEDTIADDFVKKLIEATKKLVIGPGVEKADITPLISKAQQENVLRFIDIGKKEGAKLLIGGSIPEGFEKGYYVEPTIFDHVSNSMTIAQEEIFGPVLSIIRAPREKMVEIANDSRYGLAAGLWTQDLMLAHNTAKALRAGTVFVNDYPVMSYALPFGGLKQSGLGVEKGLDGLLEYTDVKTVSIRIRKNTRFTYYKEN